MCLDARSAADGPSILFSLFYSSDSVKVFAAAVRELDATEEIEVSKINCKQLKPFEHGRRIVNYMRLVSVLNQLTDSDSLLHSLNDSSEKI